MSGSVIVGVPVMPVYKCRGWVSILVETVQSSGHVRPASPECKAYRSAVKAPARFDTTFVGGLLSASGVLSRTTEQTLLVLPFDMLFICSYNLSE